MNVLIIFGGDSPEREISLLSGRNVARMATAAGHNVSLYDPVGTGTIDDAIKGEDLALILLHGLHGEDGTIQSELERLNVPYLGSDSIASKVCFDKVDTHKILEKAGILMPEYAVVSSGSVHSCKLLKSPFVAKPINGGSSLDTVIARSVDRVVVKKVEKLLEVYGQMLIEELIDGQEVTVPILNESSLSPILTIPPDGEEFDYENKYNGLTQEIVPIPYEMLNKERQENVQKIAERVHRVTGARHLSRTDMIVTDSGEVYVLEINTIPGMTRESFYPKAVRAEGYTEDDFINMLVKMALA